MLLENLSETYAVQFLIVLQQNEHQVEFAVGQLEIVDPSIRSHLLRFLRGSSGRAVLSQVWMQRASSSLSRVVMLVDERAAVLVPRTHGRHFAGHGAWRATGLFERTQFVLDRFEPSYGSEIDKQTNLFFFQTPADPCRNRLTRQASPRRKC